MQLTTISFLYEQHPPLVAISACLAGEKVRYDGADKYLQTVGDYLATALELLPNCPEVEAGLGTPRPPVQLVQLGDDIRARGCDNPKLDVTAALIRTSQQSSERLSSKPLCGYILKSRSPSCGLGSTPLFNSDHQPIAHRNGLYAQHIKTTMPWLILRDETELVTAQQCERFIIGCRIMNDIHRAIQDDRYTLACRHYENIIAQWPAPLRSAIHSQTKTQRLLAFKQGLDNLLNQLAAE